MNSEIQDKGGAQEAGRSSLHEVLACTSDAEIGARWRQNSSLEEWFPFTAQKLKTLEAELGNAAVIAVKLGQLSKHWREASADYRQRAREGRPATRCTSNEARARICWKTARMS